MKFRWEFSESAERRSFFHRFHHMASMRAGAGNPDTGLPETISPGTWFCGRVFVKDQALARSANRPVELP
jgi:hypothetical protein